MKLKNLIYFPEKSSFPEKPWNWTCLSGPDTLDFLHRLTTTHVRHLEIGHGSPGCFLSPQGKTLASFQLWRTGPQDFAMEYEAGADRRWQNSLLSTIDRFTFSEKMKLSSHPEWTLAWIFPESERFKLEQNQTIEDGSVRLCRQTDQAFGRPMFSLWGEKQAVESWIQAQSGKIPFTEITEKETESFRIASLWPRVDFEITEDSSPLESGMRAFIADGKGCYPGQEIIEKIISLGSPPKRLVLLQLGSIRVSGVENSAQKGDVLFGFSNIGAETGAAFEVGKITSVSEVDSLALARIRKTHARENLELHIGIQSSGIEKNKLARILKIAPYE